MGRIQKLNRYQKSVLLFLGTMVLAFSVIYFVTIERVGYEYKNTILIVSQENGNIVYSGKIQGEKASFTVFADKTVEFQYGEKIYGPYTVKEDSSAMPKDMDMTEYMMGESSVVAKLLYFVAV